MVEGRKWVWKCLKVAAGVWLSVRWPGVSALRYIRLNSLRSQPVMLRHAHTYKQEGRLAGEIHGISCQRGVWAMSPFASRLSPWLGCWCGLLVRCGRKISDPELNCHYFQLTRKDAQNTHSHPVFERLKALKSGFNMKIPHYELFVVSLCVPKIHMHKQLLCISVSA